MAKAMKKLVVMMLGDSTVGKTSIVLQYCEQKFSEDAKPTVVSAGFYIGIDFKMRNVEIDGVKILLQMWDTVGQERFKSIVPSYYRGSEGIIVVFDLTSQETFKHVEQWISEARTAIQDREFPILLLANKRDLVESRVVGALVIKSFAELYNIPYYEVSALTGENIEESITEFVKGIYLKKQEKRETPDDTPKPDSIQLSHDKHGNSIKPGEKCKC